MNVKLGEIPGREHFWNQTGALSGTVYQKTVPAADRTNKLRSVPAWRFPGKAVRRQTGATGRQPFLINIK